MGKRLGAPRALSRSLPRTDLTNRRHVKEALRWHAKGKIPCSTLGVSNSLGDIIDFNFDIIHHKL